MGGVSRGERGDIRIREGGHTALKRRLLSARAGSFLSAHAGAVVTSAAGHLEYAICFFTWYEE
jgi:hypothetical protein